MHLLSENYVSVVNVEILTRTRGKYKDLCFFFIPAPIISARIRADPTGNTKLVLFIIEHVNPLGSTDPLSSSRIRVDTPSSSRIRSDPLRSTSVQADPLGGCGGV